MLRVGNLERSIDFYTRLLGMKLLRFRDIKEVRELMMKYEREKKKRENVFLN